MEMKKYYENRKELRKLYDNDTIYGDLCGGLLNIRDKFRCVNSMNIALQDYSISVELDDDTDQATKNDIVNRMLDKINTFVKNNADKLDLHMDVLDRMIFTSTLVDTIVVGNSIQINM